jgi:hypothetical protein
MPRIMRTPLPLAALLVLSLARSFAPSVAHADDVDMDWKAVTAAQAGTFAEYKVTAPKQAHPGKMRYTLVGRGDGWMVFEIDTDSDKGPVKLRLEYAKAAPNAWKLTSGRTSLGDRSVDFTKVELEHTPVLTPEATPGDKVGEEKVKTPAGTFDCTHYQKVIRTDTGEVAVHLWMSDKALPTGLVKSWAPLRGIEVVLAKSGKGKKK